MTQKKPDGWMPLHIAKYLGDTIHLTRDQHGAYLLLLMAYWMRGGPLPADDKHLSAIARATPQEWKTLKPILAEFFTVRDGKWHQKRADEELSTARKLTEAKSQAGRAGAKSRWQTHGSANGEPVADAMADASLCQWQTGAPLPSNQVPSDSVSNQVGKAHEKTGGNGVGKVGARVTIESPSERLARFQAKVAKQLGKNGWVIVARASDRREPGYADALARCQAAAKALDKGWPTNWPTGAA